MSYVTVEEAQTFLDGELNTTFWDLATDSDRTKALTMSSRLIENLDLVDDTSDNVKNASVLLAVSLLEYKVEEEISRLDLTAEAYGTVHKSYDRRIPSEIIAAGIISYRAWLLIKPYLNDTRSIETERVL